jgi:hypothetical protein
MPGELGFPIFRRRLQRDGEFRVRVLSGGEGVLIDDDQAVARILAHAVEENSTASCFSERRKTMTPPSREISGEGVSWVGTVLG